MDSCDAVAKGANNKAKLLTRVVKRAPVDVQFENLSYAIGNKEILHSVSGNFSSGKLIGILGPSGAGKTTLLNVLAGLIHGGISGDININGEPREMKKFHKISSYIMQEDLLQPLLTVKESMSVAAQLKLGRGLSEREKHSVINELVSVIGLNECMDTRVENLSGGQRKRLSVALELVNNPPVLFLDEPTTGLDNVAMKNCVELLKAIAMEGRTVICTLHQPAASLFKLFDTVYFMSDGYCIYNGSVNNMIPHLERNSFECPITYTPADYIIEIVQEGRNTQILQEAIQNGKLMLQENEGEVEMKPKYSEFEEDVMLNEFPNSFWTQFYILISRMFVQMRRNNMGLALQFGHHIFCGLLLGIMFRRSGNTGSLFLNNVKLFYGVVVYFMFTHVMAPILLYPFEVKLLQREYFNRWYSLKAYFAALTVSMLPVLVVTAIIFIAIAYPMTGQPMESERIFWFTVICLLMAVTSQGFGYSIGSLFTPMTGIILSSGLVICLFMLSSYALGYGDKLSSLVIFIMDCTFSRHGMVGLTTSVMVNRDVVECDRDICFFNDPKLLLRISGMTHNNCQQSAAYLVGFSAFFRVLQYLMLTIRIKWFHQRSVFH